MQIIKYLLYLLLLTFISIVVYIATLENSFNITNNYKVNVNVHYIKSYFNDAQNWAEIKHLKSAKLIESEFFYNNQSDLDLKLDSVATNFSLFSVYINNDKIGNMAFKFTDSISHTKINSRFFGKVSFIDKIKIFTKGISPNYYFKNVFTDINQQIKNQLNFDFNYYNFSPIKIVYQPKTYYYKSRFAGRSLIRKDILKAYQEIKKELDLKNATGNIFYIEMLIDEPERKEFFIGVPVTNKLSPKLKYDIYLDSLNAGKVLKTGFSGNITHENVYQNEIKKQIIDKNINVNFNSKINIWNENILINNPKKWTFETWYYIDPETTN